MAVRYVKEVGVADIQTEQPAEQDAGLQGVLALYAPLLAGLRQAAPVDRQGSLLVDEAVGVWNRPGFDTFLSEASLRFSPFDYQLQAARSALRRMRGRAILAGEVGLGKTIEAGLILAELRLRGLADRALVITPAGLVTQWQEELERKFGVPTVRAGRDRDIPGREPVAGSADRPGAGPPLGPARPGEGGAGWLVGGAARWGPPAVPGGRPPRAAVCGLLARRPPPRGETGR